MDGVPAEFGGDSGFLGDHEQRVAPRSPEERFEFVFPQSCRLWPHMYALIVFLQYYRLSKARGRYIRDCYWKLICGEFPNGSALAAVSPR